MGPFFRLRSPPRGWLRRPLPSGSDSVPHCARTPGACCRRWLVLAVAFIVPGFASAQDYAAKGFKVGPTSPREVSEEDLAAGKEIYESRCSQLLSLDLCQLAHRRSVLCVLSMCDPLRLSCGS